MKFKLTINGNSVLINVEQLNIIIDALADAEHLTETHVGNNKGSQGYQSAFIPVIKPVVTHELFTVSPVNQDYIDTIKLSMKLTEQTT